MKLVAGPVTDYLASDAVIDCEDPAVDALARTLRAEHPGDVAFAAASFEYVRDRIAHSCDIRDRRVTLSASETLREGVGLCFSKAHLLTAVLRAQGVPAGLCYQRLTDDGGRFDLHGLVAVHVDGVWHRQDPRGNKPGVDAQFSLDGERLAWQVRPELGERDDARVFARPSPAVVAALAGATDVLDLCDGGLPSDVDEDSSLRQRS
jgi:transglutaminase-like putative cysteine protease